MKVLFWMFIGFDQHATSEHLLSAIVEQLCKTGHSVHIIQKNTGGNLPVIPEKLLKYGVTTDVVPYQAADKGNFIARYLTELKYIGACKKYLTEGYDAVFIQSNTVAGFAVNAIRKKMPKAIITFNVQDIFPYNAVFSGNLKRNGLVFKALASIQRYGYRHSDHVITISEDMKDLLIEDGTPEDMIKVIYNWSYQDEPYDRSKLDMTIPNRFFSKEYFNVVYAGNVGVMQNVDILIETAALMKSHADVWFHIIGNGQYKSKLQKRSVELGITNITFWPMQSPEVAPSIYAAADVNIIPLEKNVYRTALPSKTATCLACGTPIIFAFGKDSSFGKRVKAATSCRVIESDAPTELMNAVLEIKENPERDENSKLYFKKYFSKTINSNEYMKVVTSKKD